MRSVCGTLTDASRRLDSDAAGEVLRSRAGIGLRTPMRGSDASGHRSLRELRNR
jgi:hypothetical protein